MLIIAIPKSASTSLLVTLGKLHHLEAVQDFSFRFNKIPELSNRIHQVHSDIRELSQNEIEEFCREDQIYKQHIFPSSNNLKLLKNIRKVILLRSPEEILLAYRRGQKQNHNSLPAGYKNNISKTELISKAKNDGFYEDLQYFSDTWKINAKSENTLFIEYKDYIQSPQRTINEIEKFFDLPLTNRKIVPAKARYAIPESIMHLKKIKLKLKSYLISGIKKIKNAKLF